MILIYCYPLWMFSVVYGRFSCLHPDLILTSLFMRSSDFADS